VNSHASPQYESGKVLTMLDVYFSSVEPATAGVAAGTVLLLFGFIVGSGLAVLSGWGVLVLCLLVWYELETTTAE
jgi:hypothetical protein